MGLEDEDELGVARTRREARVALARVRMGRRTSDFIKAATALLLGCKQPAQEHRVGETALAPDYTLAVLSVRECPAPGNELALAHRGELSLGLELELESTGRRMSYSPTFGKIVDRAGRSHNGKMYESCAPNLEIMAPLTRGKKHRGFMTFHLPKDARGLTFTFQPFAAKQEVKFALGR
jgi:hypothetical protein